MMLKGSTLFGSALTLHLAAVAPRCTERLVPPGERFCRAGETYVILSGRCRKRGRPQLYSVGECVQEFGALYSELPPMTEVEAVEAAGGGGLRLLVIEHAALWSLLVPPSPLLAPVGVCTRGLLAAPGGSGAKLKGFSKGLLEARGAHRSGALQNH